MSRFSVALSPFYGGNEWKDERSGILFEKGEHGQLKVHSVPENVDLTNILKAIRLNALILVEGSLEELEQKHRERKQKEKQEQEEETQEQDAEENEGEDKSKGKKKSAKKK